MTTTFKLYHGAATDGVAYVDLPFSGKIVFVQFTAVFVSGAGGAGIANLELSRSPTNQTATNNARGVISEMSITTSGASATNNQQAHAILEEPVKAGERLYLNCAGGAANVSNLYSKCFVTIQS